MTSYHILFLTISSSLFSFIIIHPSSFNPSYYHLINLLLSHTNSSLFAIYPQIYLQYLSLLYSLLNSIQYIQKEDYLHSILTLFPRPYLPSDSINNKDCICSFILSTMIDIQLMNHFYSSSSFLTLLSTSNCPSTILKENSIPSTIFDHQDHESISVLNALIYLYIHYSNDEFYFNTTLLSLSILMKSISSSISIVFYFSPFSSSRIQLFLYSLFSYAYNLCILLSTKNSTYRLFLLFIF